uniref:Uncharacterized protein n=1 Tax=Arundo donax TaxID=35708 RepID=A0A0A9IGQ3_ARUDO
MGEPLRARWEPAKAALLPARGSPIPRPRRHQQRSRPLFRWILHPPLLNPPQSDAPPSSSPRVGWFVSNPPILACLFGLIPPFLY